MLKVSYADQHSIYLLAGLMEGFADHSSKLYAETIYLSTDSHPSDE